MRTKKPLSSTLVLKAVQPVRRALDGFTATWLAIALTLVIASGVLTAIVPVAYKFLVDTLADATTSIAPFLLVVLYVSCQYLLKCFGAIRQFAHSLGEQRLHRRLSRLTLAHILALPLRYHLERKTGAISEILTQGLSGYRILLQHVLYTFLPILVEFTITTAALLHFGLANYLAILAGSAIAYIVAFTRGASRIAGPSREVSGAHIDANATLTDGLLNYETVKYFEAEESVCERYDLELARTEAAWRLYCRRLTGNSMLVATIFAISLGAALLKAAQEVARGAITVGDFFMITTYVLRLMQPMEALGFAIRDVSQGLSFLARLLELFSQEPERGQIAPSRIDAAAVHSEHSKLSGAVEFRNVSFYYQAEKAILRDVSFSILPGKRVAIVGASGSGKSSIIRLLFRLYEPSKGEILLDGTNISSIPLPELRRAIAIVPQDTVLFNDTIANNIAFGCRGCSFQDISRAAALAHLDELIASLPQGYDTIVGERGLRLSGGERQRIAIARAVLKRPRIFVFDEATSSLDTHTEREIQRNMLEVGRDTTTLLIAHRLSTIVDVDEILVLDAGAIVERGRHPDLLERGGRYTALWKAQQASAGTRRGWNAVIG